MTTASPPTINYDDLIVEDSDSFRISGRLYQDQAIFDEEMKKIFHQGWVFVGHESEVAEAGDYRTRWIGLQPIIMSRDEDGQVHLLLNRCRHRSATVCQEDRGNSTYFMCAYHGWVYRNTGELAGATLPTGYDESFRKEDFGLIPVPRVASHRGFVFGSLSPTGQSFSDYLGRAKDYIDRYCDMSPTGEVQSVSGRQKTLAHANWKHQVENLTDNYHVPITHQTGVRRRGRDASRLNWEDPLQTQRDLGGGHTTLDRIAGNRSLGEGLTESIAGAAGILEPEVIEGVAKRVGSREKAEWIEHGGPPHIMVFPNLMLLWNAFRIIQPVSLDLTHIYYYPLFLKGASQAVNERRLRAHESGFGPAGFINPDDADMWVRIQMGTRATVHDWTIFNRGRHTEGVVPDDFGAPTMTAQIMMETAQRGIWRHYKNVMSEP